MDTTFDERSAATATPVHERIVGGFIAFVISGIAGIVAAALNAPFLLLGIPAASIAGWTLGPRVRGSDTITIGLGMGALTVVIGDILTIVGSGMVGSGGSYGETPVGQAIAGGVFLFFIGLIIVGLPMLLITIPCGTAWAFLVRRLMPGDAA